MRNKIVGIFAGFAAIFCICSCTQSLDPNIPADKPSSSDSGEEFELFAEVTEGFSADVVQSGATTKTILNDDWTVSWSESDLMSVFNRGAGENTWSDNCRFVVSDPARGGFVKDASESTKKLISGKDSYDWYACSPWMQYGANPSGTKGYTVNRTPRQMGYGSTAHLSESDIVAGKALAVPSGTAPELKLYHVCTLLKFTVVNNTGSSVAITSLTLDALSGGSYITGSFTMDWGAGNSDMPRLDATKMGSAKAYTCTLNVVENKGDETTPEWSAITQTVADGESVDLYMIVAPFTIPAGGKMKLEITGSAGTCTLEKTMTKEIRFTAGSYNTATISYSNPEKVLFAESFGTKAIGTNGVPNYDKSGLTTFYPEDKNNYSYGADQNASIQTAPYTYTTQTTSGAYVRFPKINSMMAIKGINLHGTKRLRFSYRKDSANECKTTLYYRFSGASSWTELASSSSIGLISHDFTIENPDGKNIDIQVKNMSEVTDAKYPAIDDWKLVALD